MRGSDTDEEKAPSAYARRWLRRSPGPDAWANLAAAYATKRPSDLKRARRWYWRTERRGHQHALIEYGPMLVQGEGGRKRQRRGFHYLQRAAAMGDGDA